MSEVQIYRNQWAMVTGASAGLGAEFSRQLADKGANLVLVARREDRLRTLAEELTAKGVKTHIIIADLAKPEAPDAIWHDLQAASIKPDILINNAGFGLAGGFNKSDWPAHRDFIELMVTSYVHLAHKLFGDMMARGYGRIINVASVAGLVPAGPGHTLYGASKAFLISFSESLNAEGRNKNVHCCAVCPGFTLSEFHDVNGTRDAINKLPSFMMMEAPPVIAGGLRAMEKGKAVYVPGLVYKTITALAGMLPRNLMQSLSAKQLQKARKV